MATLAQLLMRLCSLTTLLQVVLGQGAFLYYLLGSRLRGRYGSRYQPAAAVPARTCAPSVAYSLAYPYCHQNYCIHPQTNPYCCMSYVDRSGMRYGNCRCATSFRCATGPAVAVGPASPDVGGPEQPEETSRNRTSLCGNDYRILHGSQVTDQCAYGGIANITSEDGAVVSCNAVYTMGNVDGTFKSTFLTSAQCRRAAELAMNCSNDLELELHIGQRTYPLDARLFQTYETENGASYIDINERYQSLFENLGPCQFHSCAYNEDTMRGDIDREDCIIVSWGDNDDTTFIHDGLYQVPVQVVDDGCTGPDPADVSNTFCVRANSGEPVYCVGDSGAPVYCRAVETQEWILMGVLANEIACGDSPEAKVIPVPQ